MRHTPAFPTNEDNYSKDYSNPGMELRDYFAAAALTGLIASDSEVTNEVFAATAYAIANAMLAARAAT